MARKKIITDRVTISTNKNVTTQLLVDTEDYRINEIFNLLKESNADTSKQQAIRYLLSYSDHLNPDIAKEVIGIANKMLKDITVRESVKVKLAVDLKLFLGNAGKGKKLRTTFEELRGENGFLEVEVPD